MQIVVVFRGVQLEEVEDHVLVFQGQVQVVVFENKAEVALIDHRIPLALPVGSHAFESQSVQLLNIQVVPPQNCNYFVQQVSVLIARSILDNPVESVVVKPAYQSTRSLCIITLQQTIPSIN